MATATGRARHVVVEGEVPQRAALHAHLAGQHGRHGDTDEPGRHALRAGPPALRPPDDAGEPSMPAATTSTTNPAVTSKSGSPSMWPRKATARADAEASGAASRPFGIRSRKSSPLAMASDEGEDRHLVHEELLRRGSRPPASTPSARTRTPSATTDRDRSRSVPAATAAHADAPASPPGHRVLEGGEDVTAPGRRRPEPGQGLLRRRGPPRPGSPPRSAGRTRRPDRRCGPGGRARPPRAAPARRRHLGGG